MLSGLELVFQAGLSHVTRNKRRVVIAVKRPSGIHSPLFWTLISQARLYDIA